MSKEGNVEDLKTKLIYCFRYVILTGLFYWFALTMLVEFWNAWQIYYFGKVFWENWEISLEFMFLFFLFYIIDYNTLWFRANWFHKLALTFFFSWFLADFFAFLNFLKTLVI